MIYDEMEDRPNPADERAEAWEFWHERSIKFEAETNRLRERLETIAGFGSINLNGEWEHGLRDIIRSMTDCARDALSTSNQTVKP